MIASFLFHSLACLPASRSKSIIIIAPLCPLPYRALFPEQTLRRLPLIYRTNVVCNPFLSLQQLFLSYSKMRTRTKSEPFSMVDDTHEDRTNETSNPLVTDCTEETSTGSILDGSLISPDSIGGEDLSGGERSSQLKVFSTMIGTNIALTVILLTVSHRVSRTFYMWWWYIFHLLFTSGLSVLITTLLFPPGRILSQSFAEFYGDGRLSNVESDTDVVQGHFWDRWWPRVGVLQIWLVLSIATLACVGKLGLDLGPHLPLIIIGLSVVGLIVVCHAYNYATPFVSWSQYVSVWGLREILLSYLIATLSVPVISNLLEFHGPQVCRPKSTSIQTFIWRLSTEFCSGISENELRISTPISS